MWSFSCLINAAAITSCFGIRTPAKRLLPHTAAAVQVHSAVTSLLLVLPVSEQGHRRKGCCTTQQLLFRFTQLSHQCCRYYLLFQNKGTGEKAVATKQWTAGLATKEALEVEEPMWQELGLTESMKDPDAITGGMNWYR